MQEDLWGTPRPQPHPLSSPGAADCWGRAGEDTFPSSSNGRYCPDKVGNSSLCWASPVPGPALSAGTHWNLGNPITSSQTVGGPGCEMEVKAHGHPVGARTSSGLALLAGHPA